MQKGGGGVKRDYCTLATLFFIVRPSAVSLPHGFQGWRSRRMMQMDNNPCPRRETAMGAKAHEVKPGEPGWQPAPGVTLLRTLRGHRGGIGRIAWSPDGKWLASPSQDRTVRIWDCDLAQVVRTLDLDGQVSSLAWSPCGQRIALASENRDVLIWNTASGSSVDYLRGHLGYVRCIAWSADGRIASGSNDKTIRVWDTRNQRSDLVLEGHSDKVTAVAWSPDLRMLASASDDHTVGLCRPDTGEVVRLLEGHSSR